jgi:hypothetical protein
MSSMPILNVVVVVNLLVVLQDVKLAQFMDECASEILPSKGS